MTHPWQRPFALVLAVLFSFSSFATPEAELFNQTTLLNYPKDVQSGLLFHESSDANQICMSLGFPAGAVDGSILSNAFYSNQTQNTILIGSSGVRSYQTGYGIAKIRCFMGQASSTPQYPQPQGSTQNSTVTRITSVNGNYDANQLEQITVQPGDMITLSADLLNALNNYQPNYAPVETFQWSANDQYDDNCDASDSQDCLATSNFQVNDYGVAFYVPYEMGASIQITVKDRNNPYNQDSITLINGSYNNGAYQPPTSVITSASQYPNDNLDPNTALAGQGRWVMINGQRYFVPYTYATDDDDDWSPYRNGYWTRDADGDDMIWVSYDPWGWMTDHYGVWRYHNIYGWIWSPFRGEHFRYHRHCVTFFDNNDGYVGWYPYYDGYRDGYYDGYDQGFRDGFWAGYAAANGYGTSGYNYHPGYTVVQYGHFGYTNIVNIYIRNTVVINVITGCHQRGYFYGQIPRRDRFGTIPMTRTGVIRGRIYGETPIYRVPETYGRIASSIRVNQRIPVGTVLDNRRGAIQNGQPRQVPPTTNGRGVVVAPRNQNIPLPPQTTRPAQVNPQNPGMGRPGRVQQGPMNPGQPPQRPTLPPPVNPRPVPQQPQQPRPVPQQPQQPRPVPQQPQQPRPVPQQPQQPRPVPQQPQQPRPVPQQPQQPRPVPQQPQQPRPVPQQPQQPRPVPQQPRRDPMPQPQPQRPAPGNPGPGRHVPGGGPQRR